MESESPKSDPSAEPVPSKPYNSVAMRERRKKAGVVQISFYIRDDDKQEAIKVMRDLTDRAWLALYDAGAVLHGANEARAADIRTRLGLAPQVAPGSAKGT